MPDDKNYNFCHKKCDAEIEIMKMGELFLYEELCRLEYALLLCWMSNSFFQQGQTRQK